MEVLLAVDGGGTKTEVMMLSKTGEVLAVKKYDGTNINTVGVDAAIATIETALLDFSQIAEDNNFKFAGIHFGLAGGVNGDNQSIFIIILKIIIFKIFLFQMLEMI